MVYMTKNKYLINFFILKKNKYTNISVNKVKKN